MKNKLLIAMPAWNEESRIVSVIKKIKKEGFKNILVVDDKSSDDTAKVSKKAGAKVIVHKTNLGPGGATRTIIEYARKNKFEKLVLIDSDGQHDPADIKKLIKRSEDVIIGSRMINPKGMPWIRMFYNWGGSLFTTLLFGIRVKDSQSGFKVLNRKAINVINITENHFEFCSEMILQIKRNNLSFKEVPIRVIYTQDTLSKGQNIFHGFRMLYRLIKMRIKI